MGVHAQFREHQRKLARDEDDAVVAADKAELAAGLVAYVIAENRIPVPIHDENRYFRPSGRKTRTGAPLPSQV
jgi:hypothetical protein